jgi:hypothetical protein
MPPLPGDLIDFPEHWDGEFPDFPFQCRIDVPEDYDTIQEAVDAADDDCLIVVAEGTYFETVVIDGKAVRIVGTGEVLIRPDADEAIFTITSTPADHTVQLDGLQMRSVWTLAHPVTGEEIPIPAESGRAVSAVAAAVRITNCVFEDLSVGQVDAAGTTQSGGAIIMFIGSLEVDSCDFTNCVADDGGAIACGWAQVSVSQSQFAGCSATSNGGAMYVTGSEASLSQCSFIASEAASAGGHLSSDSSTLSLHRCGFWGGSAAWGGAVSTDGVTTATLSQNQFRYHSAGESGDVWWHDTTGGAGPWLADSKLCSGTSTVGTTEGIVPLETYVDCPFCLDDMDMDGVIGVEDLIDLLSVWGTRDPFADGNNDGTVDAEDIVDLIEDFGGCGDFVPI